MDKQPRILSLGTAVPGIELRQEEVSKELIKALGIEGVLAEKHERLFKSSLVEKRYAVSKEYKNPQLTIQERNEIYKREAPLLAERAAREALTKWGGNIQEITHIISVSCTGMYAPGLEYFLMNRLKLKRSVQRFGVNFMGCFGAVRGLAVAAGLASQDPSNKILLVCTELCSLHLQHERRMDAFVANAIFADGAAAAVIGQEGAGLFDIVRFHSYALEETLEEMTWGVTDRGFRMTLSREVPTHLAKEVRRALDDLLLGGRDHRECSYAIHPGGKGILKSLAAALELTDEQLEASWDVLREYGNMSSSSLLFVLDRLKSKKQDVASLAFGPGLSFEGMLLKR